MNNLLLVFTCLLPGFLSAQNVGIGVASPAEKLDVNGGIHLGYSQIFNPGTIRWNPATQDFEGNVGDSWVSLTGVNTQWGNREQYSFENHGRNAFFPTDTAFGEIVQYHNGRMAVAAPNAHTGNLQWAGLVELTDLAANGQYNHLKRIYSPTPNNVGHFGKSIALFNHQLVIGEPGINVNGNTQQGKAYIYTFDGSNNYGAPQELIQPVADGSPFDKFGSSAAMFGDFIAVGAPEKIVNGAANSGKVYLYRRLYLLGTPTDAFIEEGAITSPDPGAGIQFGKALALSATRLAVSAPFATSGGQQEAGRVYIYQRQNNSWVYEATLTYVAYRALFGSAVSFNTTGDSILIGAPRNSIEHGYAVLFKRTGNSWSSSHLFNATDDSVKDAFGSAVLLRDGKAIIGAPAARVGINNMQGKAYIYGKNNNTWVREGIFTAMNGVEFLRFGTGVALSPDMMIAGASGYENQYFHAERGGIYYFFRN